MGEQNSGESAVVMTDAELEALEDRLPESPHEMSNFDHTVDPGLETDLRAGMIGTHSAWHFNGRVWWDAERGVFVEAVRQYHSVVGMASAETLADLMAEVNGEWGSE